MTRAMRVKEELENSRVWQNILLVVVLLGPCLVIGDGSLTPAISGSSIICKTIYSQIQMLRQSEKKIELG